MYGIIDFYAEFEGQFLGTMDQDYCGAVSASSDHKNICPLRNFQG